MARITLNDLSLRDYDLTERVSYLKDMYFKAAPEVCTERPYLVTTAAKHHGHFEKESITSLDKARLYRWVLENRSPVVRSKHAYTKSMQRFEIDDVSLFAGSTTSKFKGVPLYPEFMAMALWPELRTLKKRKRNPYQIHDWEVDRLNEEVFPHWMKHNIMELTRSKLDTAEELKLLERMVFFLASKANCISHTIPDFSKAVGIGLRAVIAEAAGKSETADTIEAAEFYHGLGEVLEGIIAYSKNLGKEARRLADEERDDKLKKELLDIAEIHERVPEHPASTFREALTTIWVCWTSIHLENPNVGLSLGRLDQVLYPYYRADIDAGRISVGDAIELVCCLWLKIGDHVPSIPNAGEQLFGGTGSNQAITIGGVDEQGEDAVNDLTYVMLRATELMKLRDPNLNARYYQGVNSEEYMRRLCEVNLETGATPALHNDRAVIKALEAKSDTTAQARDYGIVGCVEPGSNGRHYGHSAAILLNLTSVLELTLFNGCHRHTGEDKLISIETEDPRTFHSFDDFKWAFKRQATWMIERSTALNNALGQIHQRYYPSPILSALFEGPMDKGKDLVDGGATLNSSAATIIGLADVVDCLSAIEKHVFDDETLSFDQLLKALENNYAGDETLAHMLADSQKTPKWGNESKIADANAAWVTQTLDSAFGEKENYRGGLYRVGYWTMTNHAGFGRLMQATPNGRKARENFTSGITPVSGATPYLTPALNSVSKLKPEYLSGGVALNLKYTPELSDKEQMLDNFAATVEGFMDSVDGQDAGGMEIQFNITNRAVFEDAVANPQNHKELLVRVSGYTAYFNDLNPQMKKEIIDRTEYCLSTGNAIAHKPFALNATKGDVPC